jgi:hypothetical protein
MNTLFLLSEQRQPGPIDCCSSSFYVGSKRAQRRRKKTARFLTSKKKTELTISVPGRAGGGVGVGVDLWRRLGHVKKASTLPALWFYDFDTWLATGFCVFGTCAATFCDFHYFSCLWFGVLGRVSPHLPESELKTRAIKFSATGISKARLMSCHALLQIFHSGAHNAGVSTRHQVHLVDACL